jgi:FKBP-type peptidyl-prolyl cis-trans isomerase SlyD
MIKKDSVVSLSYILKNENGEELDRSESATPLAYMHGHGQIVPPSQIAKAQKLAKEWMEKQK